MNTQITIARREEKNINGRDILNIWDTKGIRHTHFIDAKNEGWEEQLQEGNSVRVYATEKRNPKNQKYPYRNIYKPRTVEEDDQIISFEEKENSEPIEYTEEKPSSFNEIDKSERIRWMNSLNNACRLVQGQVVPIDETNPMQSIVQLANVFYKLEPQK